MTRYVNWLVIMDFRLLGPLSPKECLAWLEHYQTVLTQAPLGGSLTGVKQCIRRLHQQRKEIEGFQELVERYKSLGTSTEDIEALESRYLSLTESVQARQQSLETVLQIAEVENFYQSLSNEVSERALNLVASEIAPNYPSKSFTEEEHINAYKLNESWKWLDKVSECQETHTSNAATYHQFYHRAHIVERRLSNIAAKLQKAHTDDRSQDSHFLTLTIKDASKSLLQAQEQVEWLSQTSVGVQPLKQRRRPECPQKLRALVTYAHDEISVVKDHVYEVLEAVDQNKWKISNFGGETSIVPSLVLVFASPDREAVDLVHRLRHQLLTTWRTYILSIRYQVTRYLLGLIDNTTEDTLMLFDFHDRVKVKDILVEALESFHSIGSVGQETRVLYGAIHTFLVSVSPTGTKPDPLAGRGVLQTNDVMRAWREADRLVTQLDDLYVYYQCYENTLRTTRHEERRIVNDDRSVKFVSTAYIKRLRRKEEEELRTKQPRPNQDESTFVFVHERAAQDHEDQVTMADQRTEEMEENIEMETWSQTAEAPFASFEAGENLTQLTRTDMTQFRASPVLETNQDESFEIITMTSVEETSKYVITGVTDPKTGFEISLYDAIEAGILDQEEGIYLNPLTKESMTISAAMNQGLIKVEMVDTFVEEAKTETILRTTVYRTKEYCISGAVDTRNDKHVSVDEAFELGILDREEELFVDLKKRMSMTIPEAVAQDLVVAEGNVSPNDLVVESGAGLGNFRVEYVTDPVTNATLQLDEAVEQGLVDPKAGLFLNPKTQQSVPLNKAIQQGLVVAEPVIKMIEREEEVLRQQPRYSVDFSEDSFIEDLKREVRPIRSPWEGENGYTDDKIPKKEAEAENGYSPKESSSSSESDVEEPIELAKDEALESAPVEIVRDQFEEISPEVDYETRALKPKASEIDAEDPVIKIPWTPFSVMDFRVECFKDPNGVEMQLPEAIEEGLYDPDNLAYIDPITKEEIPIKVAIDRGLVEGAPERKETFAVICIVDPDTEEEFTLDEACDRGLVNLEKRAFVEPRTEKLLPISEAILEGLVRASPVTNPVFVIVSVYDPTLGRDVSENAAVEDGILDLKKGVYVDPLTGEATPLQEAVDTHLISLSPVMIEYVTDPRTLEQITLEEAVENRILDLPKYSFVDPRTGEYKPLKEACKEGLLHTTPQDDVEQIAQEVNGEVYSAPRLSTTYWKDTGNLVQVPCGPFAVMEYRVDHVKDERGVDIPLKEAVERGIYDPETFTFIDPIEKVEIPLKEAIDKGFVEGKVERKETFAVEVFLDPNTGEELTLDAAQELGYVDLEKGVFMHPKLKKLVPVSQAVDEGLIKAKKVQNPVFVIESVLDPVTGKQIPDSDAVDSGLIDLKAGRYIDPTTQEATPIEKAAEQGLVILKEVNVDAVMDPRTGECLSLEEAVEKELVDLPKYSYVDPQTGESKPLKEAYKEGLLSLTPQDDMEQIVLEVSDEVDSAPRYSTADWNDDDNLVKVPCGPFAVMEYRVDYVKDERGVDIPLKEAVERGIYDPEMFTFIDPIEKVEIPLREAIDKGFVEGEVEKKETFAVEVFLDPNTGEELTLDAAQDLGYVDLEKGVFMHPKLKKLVPVSQAIDEGLIKAKKVQNPVFVIESVLDPVTGKQIPDSDAVDSGLIDLKAGMYIDPTTQEATPIEKAAEQDFVILKEVNVDAVMDPRTGECLSLEEAVEKELVDLPKYSYEDPQTGESKPLKQAYKEGLLNLTPPDDMEQIVLEVSDEVHSAPRYSTADWNDDDNLVKVPCGPFAVMEFRVDHVKDERGVDIPLKQAVERGLYDPEMFTFIDPIEKVEIPLKEAIDKGFVEGEVEKKETFAVEVFLDPNTGEELTLDAAQELGYVDLEKGVFLHPKLKKLVPVSQAVDEGLIKAKKVHNPVFMIESVLDPVTGKQIPDSDAVDCGLIDLKAGMYIDPTTQEAIPIEKAAEQDFVILKEVNVDAVRDPRTGEWLALEEAVENELLDLPHFHYKDPNSEERIPLQEAMNLELVNAAPVTESDRSKEKPVDEDKIVFEITDDVRSAPKFDLSDWTDGSDLRSAPKFDTSDWTDENDVVSVPKGLFTVIDFRVESVKDRNGEEIPLKKAVEKGLVDPEELMYIDPETQEAIPIIKAIEMDFVKGTIEQKETYAVESVLDPVMGEEIGIDEACERGYADPEKGFLHPETHKLVPVTKALEDGLVKANKVQNPVFAIETVFDPTTGQDVSDLEAMNDGILNLRKGVYVDPKTHETTPLPRAVEKGLVTLTPLQISTIIDPKSGERLTLEDAVERQLIDIPKYHMKDPVTRKVVPIKRAVDKGMIRAVPVSNPLYVIESVGEDLTLQEACDVGLVDPTTGKYTNPQNGDVLTIAEAAELGFVKTTPIYVASVYDPLSEAMIPLDEAAKKGIIDVANSLYVDPCTKDTIFLGEAIEKKLLEVTPVENPVHCPKLVVDPSTGDEISLEAAANKGLFDLKDGMYIVPETGDKIPFLKAAKDGQVKTVPCFIESVADPKTGQEVPLVEAVRKGLVDLEKGVFVDPLTKSIVPLYKACEGNRIQALVVRNPIRCIESVKDPKTGTFHDPSEAETRGLFNVDKCCCLDDVGAEMPMEEAIQEKMVKVVYLFVTKVTDTTTDEPLTLEEACFKGLLDIAKSLYVDPNTCQKLPLQKALEEGLLKAEKLRNPIKMPVFAQDTLDNEALPISDAVEIELVNFEKGTFLDRKEHRKISLDEAVEQNLLKLLPVYVNVVLDPATREYTSLEEAGISGTLDLPRFLYVNKTTQETLNFETAIKKGYLKVTKVKNPVYAFEKVKDLSDDSFVPFEDAEEKGLLDLDRLVYKDTKESKEIPMYNAVLDGMIITVPYYIERVMDPETAKEVSLEEAVQQGLLDLQRSVYVDPVTNKQMPISKAIPQGLVKAMPLRNPVYSIESVTDTTTGALVPVQEAIGADMINLKKGVYKDPETANEYPLHYAVEHGFAKARPVYIDGVVSPTSHSVLLDLQEACQIGLIDIASSVYVEPKSQRPVPLCQAIEEGFVKAHPICSAVLQPISAFDPTTGSCISIQEALASGLYDQTNSTYVDPESGESIPLNHAIDRDLVKTKPLYVETVRDLKTGEDLTFDEAVQKGLIDFPKSLYLNPITEETIPLEEAMTQGLVKADVVKNPVCSTEFVVDKITDECYSIGDKRASHLVDLTRGVYIDPITKEEFPLQKAVDKGLAKAVPIYVECVVDPITGEELTLEAAVIKGIVDIPKSIYLDPKEVSPIPLSQAVERGLIKVKPISSPIMCTERVYDPMSGLYVPLETAIEKGLVDLSAGLYKDPKTEETMPLEEASKQGLVEYLPVCISSVVDKDGVDISLEEAVQQDLFDISNGSYIHPETHEPLSVIEALEKGCLKVVPVRNPVYCIEAVLDQETELAVAYEEAEHEGLVDFTKGVYMDKSNDREVPLQNAVEQKFIRSVPYFVEYVVDPVTSKELSLEEAVLKGIVNIPKSLYLEPKTVSPTPLYKAIERKLVKAVEVKNPVLSPESAFDQKAEMELPIEEALAKGIVDLEKGVYKDTSNGKEMPIYEAVEAGLMSSTPVHVASVVDPKSKKEYTLAKAVEMKLLDITKGTYTRPEFGPLVLSEAVKKGYVKTVLTQNPVYVISAVLDTKADVITNVETAVKEGLLNLDRGTYQDPDTRITYPMHKAVEDWFLRVTPTYVVSVTDPVTEKELTLEEAAEKGIVNLANNTYIDPRKIEPMPLVKAEILGRVKSTPIRNQMVTEDVVTNPLTGQEHPYEEAVKLSLVDEAKGLYIIPNSWDTMLLAEAKEKGLVSQIPSCIQGVYDPDEKVYVSVEQAVDRGLIDPTKPTYIDPVSGEEIPVEKAIKDELVKTVPARNPVYVAQSVQDPNTGEMIGILDAFTENLVDLTRGVYQDHKAGTEVPLLQCKEDEVKFVPYTIASVYDPSALEEVNLAEAVERGVIDIPKSIYIDPLTIEPKPLLVAIAENKVRAVPVCGYVNCVDGVLDPKTNKRVPVESAVKQGIFDLPDGEVKAILGEAPITVAKARDEGYITETPLNISHVTDPLIGDAITLEEAVKKCYVDLSSNTYINPIKSEIMPLLSAYEKGFVKGKPIYNPVFCPESVQDTKTEDKIPVEEAVARGIIDLKSGVYCDPLSDEAMTLEAAESHDLVSGTLIFVESVVDPATGKTLTLQEADKGVVDIHAATYQKVDQKVPITLQQALENGYIKAIPAKNPVSVIEGAKDTKTGKVIPVDEAVERGLLSLTDGVFIDAKTHQETPLRTAVESGKVTICLYCIDYLSHPISGRELTLAEGAKAHILDLPKSLYVDLKDGSSMPLKTAIQNSLVAAIPLHNPVHVAEFLLDSLADSLMPMEEAVKMELAELEAGYYTDPGTNERYRIGEAIKDGVVKTKPFVIESIYNPKTGERKELEDAVKDDLIDITKCTYTNPETNETIPLISAIDQGLVWAIPLTNPVLAIQSVLCAEQNEDVTMEEAIEIGLLDIEGKAFVDPKNGKQISIPDAAEKELIKYTPLDIEYVVDPNTGKHLPLEEAVESNLLDLPRNLYLDPKKNERVPLTVAIKKGLVKATPSVGGQADYHKRPYGKRPTSERERKRRRSRISVGKIEFPLKEIEKRAPLEPVESVDVCAGTNGADDVVDGVPEGFTEKAPEGVPEGVKDYVQNAIDGAMQYVSNGSTDEKCQEMIIGDTPKGKQDKIDPSEAVDHMINGQNGDALWHVEDTEVREPVDEIQEEIVQPVECEVKAMPWDLSELEKEPKSSASEDLCREVVLEEKRPRNGDIDKIRPGEFADEIAKQIRPDVLWGAEENEESPKSVTPGTEIEEAEIEVSVKEKPTWDFPEDGLEKNPPDGADVLDGDLGVKFNPDLDNRLAAQESDKTKPNIVDRAYPDQKIAADTPQYLDWDNKKEPTKRGDDLNGIDHSADTPIERDEISTILIEEDTPLQSERPPREHRPNDVCEGDTGKPIDPEDFGRIEPTLGQRLESGRPREDEFVEEVIDDDGNTVIRVRRSSSLVVLADSEAVSPEERSTSPASSTSTDSLEGRSISPDSLSGEEKSGESTSSSDDSGRPAQDTSANQSTPDLGDRALETDWLNKSDVIENAEPLLSSSLLRQEDEPLEKDDDEGKETSSSSDSEGDKYTRSDDAFVSVAPIRGVDFQPGGKENLDASTTAGTQDLPQCGPPSDDSFVYVRDQKPQEDFEILSPGDDSGIEFYSPTESKSFTPGAQSEKILDLHKNLEFDAIIPDQLKGLQSADESALVKDIQTPDSFLDDTSPEFETLDAYDMYRRPSESRPVDSVYRKLSNVLRGHPLGIKDPQGGLDIGFDEAVANEVLKVDPLEYRKARGQTYCIQEAIVKGYVDQGLVEKMLPVYEAHSMEHFLADTRDYFANQGDSGAKNVPDSKLLPKALRQNSVDAEKVFYYDYQSHKVGSLSWAMAVDKFDPNTLDFKDPKSRKGIDLADATDAHVLNTRIEPLEVLEPIATLKFLQGKLDLNMKGIEHPVRGEDLSIKDAVLEGILDLPRFEYAPLEGQPQETIPEALKLNYIDRKTAKELAIVVSKSSLGIALDDGLIDPETGQYTDQGTGAKGPFTEAVESGKLEPKFVFFLDLTSNKVRSLESAATDGFFSPEDCQFRDPETGKSLAISEAVVKRVIDPYIDPEKILESLTTIQDLLDTKRVDLDTMFQAPAPYKPYPLRDALADEVVNEKCLAQVDQGGTLSLIVGEIFTEALEGVTRSLTWVARTEGTLAAKEIPEKSADELKEALDQHRQLMEQGVKEQDVLKTRLETARAILDSERDRPRDAGQQGQYEALERKSKTLQEKSDDLFAELRTRLTRMYGLLQQLEDFEKTYQDLQTAIKDHDRKFEDIRDGFLDTQDVPEITEELKQYENALNSYKSKLNFISAMPGRASPTDSSAIDDTIEALANNHHDLMEKCRALDTAMTAYLDYQELKKELDPRLGTIRADLTEVETQEKTDDPKVLKDLANKIKELADDCRSLKGDQDNETKAGQESLVNLATTEAPQEHTFIEGLSQDVEEDQEKYNTLMEDLVKKKHQLAIAGMVAKDLQNSITDLFNWADKCEAKLDNAEPISMDKEKLGYQLQDAEILAAEAKSQYLMVDAVKQQVKGTDEVNEKLDILDDKFCVLIPKAEHAVVKLADTLAKVAILKDLCEDVQVILDELMIACEEEPTKVDPGELRKLKADTQPKMDEIKQQAAELLDDSNIQDKDVLLAVIAAVQGQWHDLDDKLAERTFDKAVDGLDGHLRDLDQLEGELGSDDVISADPEVLKNAIKENSALVDKLEQKKDDIREISDQCNKAFRATTNDIQSDLRLKIDAAKSHVDHLSKLCADRQDVLDKTLPLAAHYAEAHDEVVTWLDETEADAHSQCQEAVGDNPEQIRKQKENAADTQQKIDDQKPTIEDLNSTGNELTDLCCPEEGVVINEELAQINQRYDGLRNDVGKRLDDLDDQLNDVTSEVSEHIDDALHTVHALRERVDNLEPLTGKPDILKAQLDELTDIEAKLAKLSPFVEKVKRVRSEDASDTGSISDGDELADKIEEFLKDYQEVKDAVERRKGTIDGASPVSSEFWDSYRNTDATLRELADNVNAIDSNSIDPEFILEQQKELKGLEDDFVKTKDTVETCHQMGDELCNICGPPAKMEVKKHLDDLDELCADIEDDIKDKDEELKCALDKAKMLRDIMDEMNKWLTTAESQISSMPRVALDARSIRIQIEELKILKVQIPSKGLTLETLNQHAKELMKAAPTTVDRLQPKVDSVNERWNDLLDKIGNRENDLKTGLVKVGEVDAAMDDVIGVLQAAEEKLEELENIYGDPRYIETHLKCLGHLKTDLNNQEETIRVIEKAVDKLLATGKEGPNKLKNKKDEMNQLLAGLYLAVKDKHNMLQDTLKEVKVFIGDVEDMVLWLTDYKVELRHPGPMGAIPYSARRHLDKFMEKFTAFEKKEDKIQLLLMNGEDMLGRCKQTDAALLADYLAKLRQRWNSVKRRANKKKKKLEGHCAYVQGFHESLQVYVEWLINAEQRLKTFKYPSKIVERIRLQMKDHKEFVSDINSHRELLQQLDLTGTYLKYFGNKHDTLYVKTELQRIKLRFKKLKRRAEERGRLFNQAHKEDVRFYNSWKELVDWLENYHTRISGMGKSKNASDVKHDMDEIRRFNHQLHAKYPSYHSTLRLGKNLKDRCTKTDPDRDALQVMLDELKKKWTQLRNVASQRQSHLDGVLISTGQYADAVQSMIDWLSKVEEDLKESNPLLGDLDTIEILQDQHKNFTQELLDYEKSISQMLSPADADEKLREKTRVLDTKWQHVQALSARKEERLHEALTTAEEFHTNVQKVLDWLPNAEAELKFRPLPEEEADIIGLIEKHDKFQDQVHNMEPIVAAVDSMGRHILQNCHPSAKKFVKYYVTVIKTRWDQVTSRTKNRRQRLQEALNSLHGNAAMTEELLDWLTTAQHDLHEKDQHPLPDDLATAQTLLKEHSDFHDTLSEKGKSIETISRLPIKSKPRRTRASSSSSDPGKKKSADTAYQNRVQVLHNKWRSVWRESVDRKKKLQDLVSKLEEAEDFKHFNFNTWRTRYLTWIHEKKYRLTDVFRQKSSKTTGTLTKDQFINGIMSSKFPTNRTELAAVFQIFDRDHSGEIEYKEFMEALRPDKFRKPKQRTEAEMIQDEIEREVSKCNCQSQLKVAKVGEGKYQFGDNRKLVLVRFLNSSVMVRVGGGWATLEKFLESHDPCRAKGKTNTELREKFNLPTGASQTRAAFTKKRSDSNASSRSSSCVTTPSQSPALSRKGRTGSTTQDVAHGMPMPRHINARLQIRRTHSRDSEEFSPTTKLSVRPPSSYEKTPGSIVTSRKRMSSMTSQTSVLSDDVIDSEQSAETNIITIT